MPKYVVTKKAFYDGAMRRPGEEITLDHKPSWAEKPAKAAKQRAAKEEAAKKQPEGTEELREEDLPANPTVQL